MEAVFLGLLIVVKWLKKTPLIYLNESVNNLHNLAQPKQTGCPMWCNQRPPNCNAVQIPLL